MKKVKHMMGLVLKEKRNDFDANVNVSFSCKDDQMKHFPIADMETFDLNEEKLTEEDFKKK